MKRLEQVGKATGEEACGEGRWEWAEQAKGAPRAGFQGESCLLLPCIGPRASFLIKN